MVDLRSELSVIVWLLIFKLSIHAGVMSRELRYNDLSRIANYAVICKLQPDKHDCAQKGYLSYGFYYDIQMEDCKSSSFGTCSENFNKFSTLTECHEQCRDSGLERITANLSSQVYCRLQPDFGYCNDYYPMWYFDVSERICRGFSYSGCGGNLNRFHTVQDCTGECSAMLAIKSD